MSASAAENELDALERTCQNDPHSAAAHNALGEAYIAAGRPRDAEQCFRTAIALSQDREHTIFNLGVALQLQGREMEAIAEFRRVVALNPDWAEPQMRLAGLFLENTQRDKALKLYERVSQLEPSTTIGRIALATVEFENGRMEASGQALRAVLASEPDNPGALYQLGKVLTRAGNFDEAVQHYSRAIAIDPRKVESYAGLAAARPAALTEASILRQMLSQLEQAHSDRDRVGFHFAIAGAFETLGDYAAAMQHYDKANAIEAGRIKAAGRDFDIHQHANAVEKTIQTFSRGLLARNAAAGSTSDLPLLIVGMPRSGTTLVEQILSSHPAVAAGDELNFWRDKLGQVAVQRSYPFGAAQLGQIADEYLDLLRSIGPRALRVTDKMPQNYLYLWLVHIVFPNARIIHCRRNPIDTCLSIYFTHFARQNFASDRSRIVAVYQSYQRLMAHWRTALPSDRLWEVDYEKLVTNPEPMIREMVGFCGLDWDEACLRPERNRRVVNTASVRQARQPIYTSSRERWRNYEPWLGEFRSLLPAESRSGPPTRTEDTVTASDNRDELDVAFDCFENGDLDRSEKLAQQVLTREPDSALALYLLGTIAARTSRREMAIQLLRRAVTQDPESSEALNDLGHLLRLEGNLSEAIAALLRACELNPSSAQARNELGEAYLAADQQPEAEDCFRKASGLSPEMVAPIYNLGVALQLQGRATDAIAAYRRAIAIDPDQVQALLCLSRLLLERGQRSEGLSLLERASNLERGTALGETARAALAFEQGQIDVAEQCLNSVVAAEPKNAEAFCRLGNLLMMSGRFDAAVQCFCRAITVEPRHIGAYADLTLAKRMTPGDAFILQNMLSQLESGRHSEKDRVRLHFAVAKTFDDLNACESAMRHYDEANRIEASRLKAAGRSLDLQQHARFIDEAIASFTPEFFARHRDAGSDRETPLFVVGMPRSGTTLIEQIISSHPDVAAGGELTFWGDQMHRAESGRFVCTRAEIGRLANEYLGLFQTIGPHALRVTDKMPQNYLQLGLMHLTFPRARIIHCRRDPVDTCLSIYFTHFSQLEDFAYDRGAIIFVYRQYQKLMRHWNKTLPADILMDIDYERLVANPDPVIRKLIAFGGLEWDDRCLRPEQNERIITTSSMRQARQPVYRSSVQRWRRYEPWLGEFARLTTDSLNES